MTNSTWYHLWLPAIHVTWSGTVTLVAVMRDGHDRATRDAYWSRRPSRREYKAGCDLVMWHRMPPVRGAIMAAIVSHLVVTDTERLRDIGATGATCPHTQHTCPCFPHRATPFRGQINQLSSWRLRVPGANNTRQYGASSFHSLAVVD
jgi:hypothetical protein